MNELTPILEYPPTQPWTGRVPLSTVIPNPEQPRTEFEIEALRQVSESMEEMQIQPIIVMAYRDPARPEVRWMIVDGERRWRGVQMSGSVTIAVICQPGITPANIHEKAFAANFCRVGHTHIETARAIDKQVKLGKSYAYIGRLVGKPVSWVQMEHKVLKLAPELMPLVDCKDKSKGKRMPIRVAALLADLPHPRQREQWTNLQSAPASSQFTQLRLSGDIKAVSSVHRGKQRDDDTFFKGLVESSLKSITEAANVPRAVLKDLRPESIAVLEQIMSKVENQVAALRRRITESQAAES